MTEERLCPYFFAYGTLRRGARKDLLDLVGSGARLLGRASAAGRLYDLGTYPGMLDAARDGERVLGELYELDHPQSILNRLDEYEGEDFRREIRSVSVDGRGPVDAWVYLFQGPVGVGRRIASGDYFKGKG